MPGTPLKPRWYHTLRGLVFGIALGWNLALLTIDGGEWARWRTGIWPSLITFAPLWIGGGVLALVEIGIGIRNFNAVRRRQAAHGPLSPPPPPTTVG